jgi:glutathione synthase
MRIGFVVNDIATERANYSTTRLAITALRMGHEAWVIGVGDFAYDPDQSITVRARSAPKGRYTSGEKYLTALRGTAAKQERLSARDLDVILLRYDPAEDIIARPWAQHAGIVFGQRAAMRGTIVLNDPDGLSKALNKMYFQDFPEEVRPRTLITRDRDEIRAFAKNEKRPIVLKPLAGSGGQNVFLVRPEDQPNLNQMIDAIARDGYVVAQEYLPTAEQGDTRLFMMNAQPLVYKGKYAAFRRQRSGGDLRSNLTVGGKIAKAEITRAALRMAEIIRPKLVTDGMFLVGLDIVGDKLMEVNVFSPGGLGSAQKLEGVDFSRAVIGALERKSEYHTHYRRGSDNPLLATL